jgi:hypothetical protein
MVEHYIPVVAQLVKKFPAFMEAERILSSSKIFWKSSFLE